MDHGMRIARVRLTVWTYAAGSCASWLTVNWPQEGRYVAPQHDRRSFSVAMSDLADRDHLLAAALLAHKAS